MKSAPPIQQKLSVRRAKIVKKYLTGESISPNRIYAGAKGPLPNQASAVLGVARRRLPAGDPIAASGLRSPPPNMAISQQISIPQFETGWH